jgi:hypothetical protein
MIRERVGKIKNILLVCWVVPFFYSLKAQSYDCLSGYFAKVQAPSGLSLRAKAQQQSLRMALIPDQTVLYVCKSEEGALPYETIEGRHGTWVPVFYGNREGYVFSGFLTAETSTGFEIVAPSEWASGGQDMISADTSRRQWGIFKTTDKNRFKVERLTHLMDKREENQHLHVRTSTDIPVLLFEGKKWQPIQRVFDGFFFTNQDFIPGENYKIGTPEGGFTLVSTKTTPNKPSVKQTLVLRYQDNQTGEIQEQCIVQTDQMSPQTTRYDVVFFGDMDGDNRPDLLVRYWYHHEMYELRLLLSTPAEKGFLIKKVCVGNYSSG